ncbi:unnamed protein product [Phytophthora fragariaefolia]|uniref:Unnamed protein product n=1 Tax=Phytophthora fragariaefolia TaxID=1490495 RepID=A0A9W6YAD4_9STRA|nr:unnamed protein product [Phytophthora fragariaefolia]
MFVEQKGGRVEAGLVEKSTKCWNSTLKRSHSDMEEDADYHGNFDTAKFDRWFMRLCKTLKAKHGECNIHMDGASHHKNQLNKSPTMSWTRAQIQNWLNQKGQPAERKARIHGSANNGTIWTLFTVYTTVSSRATADRAYLGSSKGTNCKSATKNGNDAVEKVLNGLYAIKRKEFINVYRHAQSFENKYANLELESAELRLMACEDKS